MNVEYRSDVFCPSRGSRSNDLVKRSIIKKTEQSETIIRTCACLGTQGFNVTSFTTLPIKREFWNSLMANCSNTMYFNL